MFPMTQQSEAVNILKKKVFGYSWDNRMEISHFNFFQNYGAQVLPLHVQNMFCNNCFSKLCNILAMECICTKNLAQKLEGGIEGTRGTLQLPPTFHVTKILT